MSYFDVGDTAVRVLRDAGIHLGHTHRHRWIRRESFVAEVSGGRLVPTVPPISHLRSNMFVN